LSKNHTIDQSKPIYALAKASLIAAISSINTGRRFER